MISFIINIVIVGRKKTLKAGKLKGKRQIISFVPSLQRNKVK